MENVIPIGGRYWPLNWNVMLSQVIINQVPGLRVASESFCKKIQAVSIAKNLPRLKTAQQSKTKESQEILIPDLKCHVNPVNN